MEAQRVTCWKRPLFRSLWPIKRPTVPTAPSARCYQRVVSVWGVSFADYAGPETQPTSPAAAAPQRPDHFWTDKRVFSPPPGWVGFLLRPRNQASRQVPSWPRLTRSRLSSTHRCSNAVLRGGLNGAGELMGHAALLPTLSEKRADGGAFWSHSPLQPL